MRPNNPYAFIAILLSALALPPTASAATLHVPADHPTIQSCINAAVSGQDECVVAPGTYNELINFLGKAITLRSSHGAEVTIIDGTGLNGTVITCVSTVDSQIAVDGFTIKGGVGNTGGGLYLYGCSATINNNKIIGNRAAGSGAGLYVRFGSYEIRNNSITGNIASGSGGGLALVYAPNSTIANNTITGNKGGSTCGGLQIYASSPSVSHNSISNNSGKSGGGGICVSESSAPIIDHNTISRNDTEHGGGGISVGSGSPTISNNLIAGNRAGHGGGLYVTTNDIATIANNRIVGNHAGGSGTGGGGLHLYSSSPIIVNNLISENSALFGGALHLFDSSAEIANNTIAGNVAAVDGGGVFMQSSTPRITNSLVAFNSSGMHRAVSGTPMLLNNCIYGNPGYNYSGLTDPTGTNGNISTDPLFADLSYGNLHIQPGSPCIDSGSNAEVRGALDIDEQARVYPQDGHADIGADESDGTPWEGGPNAVIRVKPSGNDASDGASWATAKRTVQAGIDAASDAGGEVWVQAGTYYERPFLYPYAYVYGGFAGKETIRNQRDLLHNRTTLDGQQQGSVVSVLTGNRSSAIDGFTITNGNASYGGGFYVIFSSPTIANNTITRNTATNNGGGITLGYASPQVVNNLIADNSADNGGGLNLYSSSPAVVNNTFVNNTGAINLDIASFPRIANNIVAFNYVGIRHYSGTPTFRHNCIYGNGQYDYSGAPNPIGTNGNVSVDPLLASREFGQMHIQPKSPCVDAGDNSEVVGDVDIDGQERVYPPGGIVDIGADESDGTNWSLGPYVIVRVSLTGNDENDGLSWSSPKRTVQAGILAASASGGEVWVQGGTYHERLELEAYTHVFGGFCGSETTREERDWVGNLTTIDAQNRGVVVSAHSGFRDRTLDGFSITNGGYSGLYGGGFLVQSSSPMISNNRIEGNQRSGIYLAYSRSNITNNVVKGNGDGVHLVYSSATLTNNTILGNDGEGIYLYYSSAIIGNNIIAYNSAGVGGFESTPTMRNNCNYGNGYNGLNPFGTNGNISLDPRLADGPFGNVHIQSDSPCVDAGNNAYSVGTFDIDGEPRIHPLGGKVDIGADESDGTTWLPGPYAVVRVSPGGSDANDGSTWPLAKQTVQAAIDAASASGGEVWVRGGTYDERVILRPYVYLYGGFAGFEFARDQRDWKTHVTTLNGQRGGTVVTAVAGYRVSAVDGFTITGGSGNSLDYNRGGGLYLERSSPAIANNAIIGNSASDGGGIYLSYCSPTITNNTIAGNRAVYHGGALYLVASPAMVANNTITHNQAFDALYLIDSDVLIANSIIAFNSSGIYRNYGYLDSPTLRYNCGSFDRAGQPGYYSDTGNITLNPSIIRNPSDGGDGWGDDPLTLATDESINDDYGDLRLQPGSPCVNVGDPNFIPQPGATDLDGHARVLCGRVDMGAYESGIGDFDCDQNVNLADLGAWEMCETGPGDLPSPRPSPLKGEGVIPTPRHSRLKGDGAIGCETLDFDGDGDVDLGDLAQFFLIVNP